MIRNLKVLGFALAALFVLSAAIPAAASAQTQGKLTSDGPVTLTVTELGTGENIFKAFGGTIEFPGSTYTGHKYNVTPHTFIPSGETIITLTPDYKQSSCVFTFVGIKHPCTITMNGCDYVLHLGSTNGVDAFAVTTDIVCPVGQKIDTDAYPVGTLPSEHATKAQFCTTTIPAQTGLSGLTLTTDTVNDDFNIKGTLEKITVSKSLAGCGASEEKSGKLQTNVTVKGKNEAGGNTGITVTD